MGTRGHERLTGMAQGSDRMIIAPNDGFPNVVFLETLPTYVRFIICQIQKMHCYLIRADVRNHLR